MTSRHWRTDQAEMEPRENELTRERLQECLYADGDESEPTQPPLPSLRPPNHFDRHDRHQAMGDSG